MGVSGSGKTTVGRLLAEAVGFEFIDADDLHPPENIKKMAAGEPLTDADRMPWLLTLREAIQTKEQVVLACSALKGSYRAILADGIDARFVYLRGDPELIRERLKGRPGHFMKADMADSQFEILEEPEDAVPLDISNSAEDLISEIRRRFGI